MWIDQRAIAWHGVRKMMCFNGPKMVQLPRSRSFQPFVKVTKPMEEGLKYRLRTCHVNRVNDLYTNHKQTKNNIWRFPKIGVPPVLSSIFIGFSINHPAIGDPPWPWKHCSSGWSHCTLGRTRNRQGTENCCGLKGNVYIYIPSYTVCRWFKDI
jgi:hypothetical protein